MTGMIETIPAIGFSLHEIICDEAGKPIDYRFLDVNPAFEQLTGLRREEVIGKRVLEVLPRTEPYWIERFGAVALTGEPILFENYAIEQNRFVKAVGYRPAPNQFACVFADSSSEHGTAEHIFRLNFALKAARLGAFEMNMVDHTAWRSNTHAEIFGYKDRLPDWSYDLFLAHIVPEERERVRSIYEHARNTNTEMVFETRITREDGAVRWIWVKANPQFDAYGKPTRLFGVIQDITERKQAEEALVRERNLLQTVMDGAKNSHLVYLDREFNFVRVNKAYADSCRYRPEWMIGKNYFALYPDPKTEEIFVKVRDTGEPFEIRDNPFAFPDQPDRGVTYWDWALTPIKDRDGVVTGLVFSLIETTERKRNEESRQNVQKLEALGNLAAGIAHDFNNLLAGMFGYVEIAMDEINADRPAEAEKSLTNAFAVFDRTKMLTRKLLTFAEGGAPVRKTVESAVMIRNIVNAVSAGFGAAVLYELEENLWPCFCDKNQMEQALGNIVVNALQAEPEGGKVIVSARNEHIPSRKADAEQGEGNFIRISVRDHGPGIEEEHLSKIYDPFFSTKEMGRGLGLSVAYSIVIRHGGFIHVASEREKGTTFHIFLPATATSGADSQERGAAAQKRHTRVLIMDDEKIVRETMGATLRRMGYEVVETDDGIEALSLFSVAADSEDPFDMIILDLVVHDGMDGKEAVKSIRAVDTRVPIFAVSGYADDPAISHPEQYGFTASICKPFRREELKQMLDMYLTKQT